MGSSHMCRDTLIIFSSCGGHCSSKPSLKSHRYCQMHFSLNILFVRNAFAACLWGILLLALFCASYSVAFDPFESMAISSPVYAHATRSSVVHYDFKAAASYKEHSDFIHQHAIRISASDLQSRLALERSIQLAAFQQFDSHKTGRLYNVSVPGLLLGNVLAIRLRSGSFRRYGVNISEFIIHPGCIVDPIPERILLVYARLVNTSLFQGVPAGFVLASPVLSVHVYDAGNLNSSETPQQLSVSTTASPISIEFPQSSNFQCAQFADNSTAVNITNLVQGVCQVDHLGTFALVNSAIAPAPSPSGERSSASSTRKKHSNTWKIVVGSVIGGLVLLALVSLLALGIGRRRKDAKLSRMEYQTEQGETLQMATVRNSRVPAAANTRTQATLVNEYAV